METMTNLITGDAFANTCIHQSPDNLTPKQSSSPQDADLVGGDSADSPAQRDLSELLRDYLYLANKVYQGIGLVRTHMDEVRDLMDIDGDTTLPVYNTTMYVITARDDARKAIALISPNEEQFEKAGIDLKMSVKVLQAIDSCITRIAKPSSQMLSPTKESGDLTEQTMGLIRSIKFAQFQLGTLAVVLFKEIHERCRCSALT